MGLVSFKKKVGKNYRPRRWALRQFRKPFSLFQMVKVTWEKELTAHHGETSRGNTVFK